MIGWLALHIRLALTRAVEAGTLGPRYRLLHDERHVTYAIVPHLFAPMDTNVEVGVREADALLVVLSDHRSGSFGRDGRFRDGAERIGAMASVRYDEGTGDYTVDANPFFQGDATVTLTAREADELIVALARHRKHGWRERTASA